MQQFGVLRGNALT